MKIHTEVKIQKPAPEVIGTLSNPSNNIHWQPEFVSYEHLAGIPDQPGATGKYVVQNGNFRDEFIETIIANNLPDEITAVMESKWLKITNKHKFFSIDENTTNVITDADITFKGLAMLLGWMTKSAIQKQTSDNLAHFKDYIEKGVSVKAPSISSAKTPASPR